MYVSDWGPEVFMPFLVFSIPIIAIVGGITAGIIRTLGRQRLMELAQRERIAAIERGIDPSKLPPLPSFGADEDGLVRGGEYDRRRSQGLMIGGIVTMAVGAGLMIFLNQITDGQRLWSVGVIPFFIGVSLLLSAWLVRGRGSDGPGPSGPAN